MSCNGILMSPDIIFYICRDVSECVCGEFVMIVVFYVSSFVERHSDFIVVIFIRYLYLRFHSVSVVLGGDLCFCVWSLISSCIICNDPVGTHTASVALWRLYWSFIVTSLQTNIPLISL